MPPYTLKSADRHHLYEKAVQCVEADIDFIDTTYKKARGRKPTSLREDFCGTFAAAVEFVNRRKKNRAIGVDIDPEVLAWGREYNLPKLKSGKDRLTIIEASVLDVWEPTVDVLMAMNFSYMLFKERHLLLQYFQNALRCLEDDGMLFLDIYGGWETMQTQKEKHEKDGFTYVWHQAKYNPLTSEVLNHIHFHFDDGTKMKKAFTYDWRLWTVREITDILREAGFCNPTIYWEGWDEDEGCGDGIFTPVTKPENCESWIAYIVGEKR